MNGKWKMKKSKWHHLLIFYLICLCNFFPRLNGDLALIPQLSDNSRESMNKIIDSPPTVDLHRLMNELQDFISIDVSNFDTYLSSLQKILILSQFLAG